MNLLTTFRIATVAQRIYDLCDKDADGAAYFADVFPLASQTKEALIAWLSHSQSRAMQDSAYEQYLLDELENGLNILAESDFFGTECQLDPRGDGRIQKWSMHVVQGIDD